MEQGIETQLRSREYLTCQSLATSLFGLDSQKIHWLISRGWKQITPPWWIHDKLYPYRSPLTQDMSVNVGVMLNQAVKIQVEADAIDFVNLIGKE